ncbi:NEK3 kinase, partial [Polyodon spathula]|nr:NEK3 kinase [Polyodon spathula]
FQANSWKSLILKICRGSYPPLPPHYSYELHYLIKQMFKINPKDRPSISNILTRHRVSKLIKKYLPLENEEQVSKWKKGEGEKVAWILSEKTLEETTSEMEVTPAGPHVIFPEASKGIPRKKWGEGPSDSVLHTLENTALISSGTMEPADNADSHELLHGPLSHVGADDTDGDMEETVDSARLEPRSDDEDTHKDKESDFLTLCQKLKVTDEVCDRAWRIWETVLSSGDIVPDTNVKHWGVCLFIAGTDLNTMTFTFSELQKNINVK